MDHCYLDRAVFLGRAYAGTNALLGVFVFSPYFAYRVTIGLCVCVCFVDNGSMRREPIMLLAEKEKYEYATNHIPSLSYRCL